VVVPAFVHRFMAQVCTPHLHDGQVIILNPGRTGGALEFSQVLRQAGVRAHVYIAEAQTLVYACRIKGPARVWISGIKKRVPVAALPSSDTPTVLEVARLLYPEFYPAANVLETSLDNIGAVFHPTTVIFNANRIEAGEDFDFYRGMTPTVVSFLELIDEERLAVARAYGVHAESAKDWLAKTYNGVTGETLYERIQNTRAYWGIKAPKTLNVRYITEDIPTGLVPIVSFAKVAGLETPASRAIVDICCGLHRRNYWAEGRTVKNLGLDGMGVKDILSYVNGKGG
jgi:opine dehydrogenase